jgi:hypothetical protein
MVPVYHPFGLLSNWGGIFFPVSLVFPVRRRAPSPSPCFVASVLRRGVPLPVAHGSSKLASAFRDVFALANMSMKARGSGNGRADPARRGLRGGAPHHDGCAVMKYDARRAFLGTSGIRRAGRRECAAAPWFGRWGASGGHLRGRGLAARRVGGPGRGVLSRFRFPGRPVGPTVHAAQLKFPVRRGEQFFDGVASRRDGGGSPCPYIFNVFVSFMSVAPCCSVSCLAWFLSA